LRKIITISFFTALFASISGISTFAQNEFYENQIRLAKSFEARGQLEKAQEIYSVLHDQMPKNFQVYSNLFKNLVSQKKYDEAEILVKSQLKISASKINLFGDLGSLLYLKGNEKEALEVWEEALTFEPDNPFAFRTIANYMIENRLIENAIEVLERGNAVSDDPTIFSYDIANYYSVTMKFERATDEYCRILNRKPTQLTLVKTKIGGYINSNLAEEPTLNTVKKWYDNTGEITYLKLLANLFARSNKDLEALKTIQTIEKETSRNGSAIFNFAQQASMEGNYKIASLAYREIIDNYPNSALFSESEIGYTRSLELDLLNKKSQVDDWKPLKAFGIIDTASYAELVGTYESLALKYRDSNIGWESEYRAARIYHYYLGDLKKAENLYVKIVNETRSLQFIAEANFGLANLAIQNMNLVRAVEFLSNVTSNKIAKAEIKNEANYLLGRINMWEGNYASSVENFNKVIGDAKKEYVNDALQYLLLINTFRKDSTNLLSFVKSDYLIEIGKFDSALVILEKLVENENLFILKDFAGLRYSEILISLNNYQEAGIFLESISNCDEDNIFKDRFLFLLGSNYFYGLNNKIKAIDTLNKLFDEFPNSIYYNKARNLISQINVGVDNTL
jgi:tetratricopeptide (TPR) repeat protein